MIEGSKSIPWKKWNDGRYEEKFIGVVNVPNAMNVYAVYYDTDAHLYFSENISEETRIILAKQIELLKIRKESGQPMGFGYKGLVKTGEGQNVAESNTVGLLLANSCRNLLIS